MPVPIPEWAIPMASPLLSSNHLTTAEIVGTTKAPVPKEAMPQNRYNCQSELICEDSINPKPAIKPLNKTTVLGPYLSLRRPIITAEALFEMVQTEKTEEVIALLQPNSSIKGLKNTP